MATSNSLNYKCFTAPFSEVQLAKVFKNHDKDGDGRLTKEELKKAFRYLGYMFTTFRVHEALRAADDNGDNVISLGEMSKLILYTTGHN